MLCRPLLNDEFLILNRAGLILICNGQADIPNCTPNIHHSRFERLFPTFLAIVVPSNKMKMPWQVSATAF